MSKKIQSASLIKYGSLLYKNGLIEGLDGNLSIRLDKKSILITPSGLPKGFLKPKDLIVADLSGRKISGSRNASSEIAMHLQVYQNRPDIWACCHAHPPFATAFAAAGKKLPENILPEMILFVGNIRLAEYIPTGVASQWKKLAKYINKDNAVLLGNHGVLTLGRDMPEAYFRMEAVEHLARIAWLGKSLGGLKPLDKKEVTRLKKLKEKF